MNEHLLNAMSMIASAHRDLYQKYPLTSNERERVEDKLIVALGDLAYYSNHHDEREQREAARWPATMEHLHQPRAVQPGESGLLIEGTMPGKVEWPIIPHQHQAPPSKEALARMLACGSFLSNPHGFRRPQTMEKCNAMTYDQCRTCYEVNDRDCCGYEDRMQEAQREAK